jgi:pyruvate-ferredoxin/flavodoxin oxidoreductase
MSTQVTQTEEPVAPKSVPYKGIPAAVDGAEAVVWVERHICQGACAYPITPTTTMGSGFEAEVGKGGVNLWGDKLFFVEPESEHSAASAAEGFAVAGGRVTNFTSGQGLILMKEVLYVISGKRLPVVFHIGARAMTSHSLNIHAGHDDIMGVADCGWGVLFGRNAQEAADLALIARRAAEATETPFFNVQDGFLTTHTVESVLLPEPEMMEKFIGPPTGKLKRLFDTHNPTLTGSVQNQDSYMKGKVAQRYFTDQMPAALEEAFAEYSALTGRDYTFVDGYRMDDAEYAIVGLGSMMETAAAAVDWLREKGMKIGVVHLTVFRPFPGARLVSMLQKCKGVAILERMDDPLAQSNPLAMETKAAFAEALNGNPDYPAVEHLPRIMCGVGGLGGRDMRPGDIIAIANALAEDRTGLFAVGIKHPMALERKEDPDVRPKGAFSLRGHSVGGFGSVTTNKVIASVSADVFGKHVQAFPKYGSEKKGLPTSYYLTAGGSHVRVHSELAQVDMVAVHDLNAFDQGDPLVGLLPGGALFLSTALPADKIWEALPITTVQRITELGVKVYILDTQSVAKELAPTAELSQRMQGILLLGVFLKVAPFAAEQGLEEKDVFGSVEKSLEKYFGKRGRKVVEANLEAARRGFRDVQEIPAPPKGKAGASGARKLQIVAGPSEFDEGNGQPIRMERFDRVMDAYGSGNEADLEADRDVARSLMGAASAARRDFVTLAPDIPEFLADKCVGCMECVNECPDSAIFARVTEPEVLDKAIAAGGNGATEKFKEIFVETKKYFTVPEKKGDGGGYFALAFDPMKCKGCGECVDVCGSHAALEMVLKTPESLDWHQKTTDFLHELPNTPKRFISERALGDMMLDDNGWLYAGGAGSCMGCGEATAIRMMLAATGFYTGSDNLGIVAATGCNTVYGSTYPYNPYSVAWINSLFENAPTVAMGVRGHWDQMGWQDKKLWVFGGDGAMYDIGFQALSRMLASGMDIKVLVMDTQVYSNTGGQASTASFVGQEAKMASHGKASTGKVERRKELGPICMMHPNVYVAQTTPAHINHFYKSIIEANEFKGPAVVIAYSPCQPEHGIADDASAAQCKLVVESRTFPMYIYDPRKGDTIEERLDLKGNPAIKQDWYQNPKTGDQIDFVYFARTEGRFRKHFGKDGEPTEALMTGQADRLANWHVLQELAGLRSPAPPEPKK